jgi:hypothetical protein
MTQTDEFEFAPARLAVLLQHFAEIDDDREAWRVANPLKEVLLRVTCATIASCDDFEMIVTWGEHNLDFLRRFSAFHHGVPCARWLRDLLNRINPMWQAGGQLLATADPTTYRAIVGADGIVTANREAIEGAARPQPESARRCDVRSELAVTLRCRGLRS